MNDCYIDRRGCSFLSSDPPKELIKNYISNDKFLKDLPNSDIDRSTILWIIALAAKLESSEIWKDIPGYRHAAYGYLDDSFEPNKFGVIIYAHPIVDFEDQARYIEINQYEFPVSVRRSIIIPHSSLNVHPSLGTASCWAESSKTGLSNPKGFLTVKHDKVLPIGVKINDRIQLTKGYGTVVDLGPDGIDAALIAPDDPALYNPGKSFLAEKYPIPWQSVSFKGRVSRTVNARITAVNDLRGVVYSSNIPLRIYLSDYGSHGDSGAMVFGPNGEGIGIYAGKICDPRGREEGYAQHLSQVAGVMSLTLFN